MARVVLFHDGQANRLGLEFKVAHKYVHLVTLVESRGYCVRKQIAAEYKARPVMHKGKPYPIARLRRLWKSYAATWGMTPAAATALKEARDEI